MEIIQLDFLRKFSPNFLGVYNKHIILEIPDFKDSFENTEISYNILSSGTNIDEAEYNMANSIKIIQLDENHLFNKFIKKIISLEIYSFKITIISDKNDDIFVTQLNCGNYRILASDLVLKDSINLLYTKFLTLT